MKNKISLFIILCMLTIAAGCARTAPPPPEPAPIQEQPADQQEQTDTGNPEPEGKPEDVAYRDGEYTAEGDAWEYGQENATVLIQDGKIESIALRRLTTDGDEVDYEEWTGVEVDGRLRPNLKQYREDVAQAMIEKQNYEVDGIAGATVTVNNWKLAVRRALEEAQENQ